MVTEEAIQLASGLIIIAVAQDDQMAAAHPDRGWRRKSKDRSRYRLSKIGEGLIRVGDEWITSTLIYDGMSRLKELKHATSSTTLYDDQFAYNSANQISQTVGLSQTRNYTYDNINRLTGEQSSRAALWSGQKGSPAGPVAAVPIEL